MVSPGESFYHAPRQPVASLARGYGWGDAGCGADRAWKESEAQLRYIYCMKSSDERNADASGGGDDGENRQNKSRGYQ